MAIRDRGQIRRRPPRGRLDVGRVLLGGFLGCLIGVVALLVWRNDPVDEMTPDRLEAASTMWEARRPNDYELDLVIKGRAAGTISVVSRNLKPISVVRDGRELPQASWDYWSVDGLFEMMHIDLETAAKPGRSLALLAEFDAAYGFPRRYRRIEMGVQRTFEWEVTRFVVPRPAGL